MSQEKMKREIEEMTQENADTTKLQQCKDPMKKLQMDVTQIQDSCGKFLWYIDNWEDKVERGRKRIEKSISSDPFYSHKNGYKLRLRLEFGVNLFGNDHFSLRLHILRGEFDNILQWPFRHEVKFDLLNQETGLPHSSWVLKATDNQNWNGWKMPSKEENEGIWFNWFIYLSDLQLYPAVCQGNQICIKATPNITP